VNKKAKASAASTLRLLHHSIIYFRLVIMSRVAKDDEAPSQQHAEDVESQIIKPNLVPSHVDRAAQMIGAQHIEVTEEDVSFIFTASITRN
jgi:hypothetical protein